MRARRSRGTFFVLQKHCQNLNRLEGVRRRVSDLHQHSRSSIHEPDDQRCSTIVICHTFKCLLFSVGNVSVGQSWRFDLMKNTGWRSSCPCGNTHKMSEIQFDRNVTDGDILCRITTQSVTKASYCLLLLSRSNGDAPVLMTARRLDDSRAGWFITRRSCSIEHSNARFFARFRFVEAHLVQSFSFTPESRKRYTHKCL